MRLARVLGAVGRTCITAGVLILLFVVYQLWGTGIRTAQAQDRLDKEFEQALAAAETTTTTSTTTPEPGEPVTVAPIEPPPVGDPVAQIVIPAIGVDWTVVEGVSLTELKNGPGHYPQTVLPGQEGNAAIAGHRTTYGAPFHRLDELETGDEITITTVQGEFTYVVDALHIVKPTDVHVLDDKGDNRLTLSACHPKYSARERIVAVSKLAPEEEPLPAPPRPTEEPVSTTLDDIDGEGAPAWPAIALGLGCAAIWIVAWLIGKRWRKWPAYLIGFPFFMVALFFFFEEFSRLLPSNF